MWSIAVVREVAPAGSMGVVPIGRASVVVTRALREPIVVARDLPLGAVMIDYGGTTELHAVECALYVGDAGVTVRVATVCALIGSPPSVVERWLRIDDTTRSATECPPPSSPGTCVSRAEDRGG